MLKKILILVIIIGAAAVWYFGYGPGKAKGTADNSNLPPIRVDQSSLTKAGQDKLAEVRESVSRLQRSTRRTWREFEQVKSIGFALAALGDQRSAAEWFLLYMQWYEDLPREDRNKAIRKSDSMPDLIPAVGCMCAAECYLLLGETQKAFELMEAFLKRHPTAESAWLWVAGTYDSAKKDLQRTLKESHLRSDPQYVK